jgi:hypothetical protein
MPSRFIKLLLLDATQNDPRILSFLLTNNVLLCAYYDTIIKLDLNIKLEY